MSEILTDTSTEEQSPRSTVMLADSMAAGVLPGMISDGSVPSPEDKGDSPDKTKESTGSFEDPLSALPAANSSVKGKKPTQQALRESERATPTTPLPYEYSYSYPSLTPQQQRSAYGYTSYPLQTPEPASPGTHGHVYDVGSFLQPIGAFHPATGNSTFLGHNGSPTRMTPIPPPSPLFPRATTLDSQPNQPPVLPYMSPPLGANGVSYHGYPSPRTDAWDVNTIDRNAKAYHLSPQLQGYRIQQGASAGRSYTIEDSMLPPPTLEDQAANPAYSPYAGSQGSAYSMISSWPYGGPGDPYSAQPSPLQPRPTTAAGMYPGGAPRAVYGQYYPSTSPGPPIQTTACNKGPDGANLFIFHIPNHFTNYDMYQLFDPYGTLLSVRIMVEKDTGRSRGFGFVSYDSPESAALAIKELNGFAIGNKRLKVQHKQIRRHDVSERDDSFETTGGGVYPANYNAVQGELWLDAEGHHHEKTAPLDDLGQLQNALPDVVPVAEGSC